MTHASGNEINSHTVTMPPEIEFNSHAVTGASEMEITLKAANEADGNEFTTHTVTEITRNEITGGAANKITPQGMSKTTENEITLQNVTKTARFEIPSGKVTGNFAYVNVAATSREGISFSTTPASGQYVNISGNTGSATDWFSIAWNAYFATGKEHLEIGVPSIDQAPETMTEFCNFHNDCNNKIFALHVESCIARKGIREILWSPPIDSCEWRKSWHIYVPKDHALIFEGYLVRPNEGAKFEYCCVQGNANTLLARDETKEPKSLFELEPRRLDMYATVRVKWLTTVIFRYTFHSVSVLPVLPVTNEDVGSGGRYTWLNMLYNCSSPYTVPDLWKCDVTQQCLELEDEPADCPYRNVSPYWSQNGPNWSKNCTHHGPDNTQNGADCTHNDTNRATTGHTSTQNDQNYTQKGTNCTLNCTRSGPDCTKDDWNCTHNGPKNTQNGRNCLQNCTKNGQMCTHGGESCTQNGPNRTQNGPECSENCAQIVPNRTKNCTQNGPNCTHSGPQSNDCGPLWVQFGDKCLHIMSTYGLKKDRAQLCQREHKAVRIAVVSKEQRDVVAYVVRTVLRKPGNVSFLLKKVNTIRPSLAHLYRLLWQWGGVGGPIAYQQLDFARTAAQEECAVMQISETSTTIESTGCRTKDLRDYLLTDVCVKSKHGKQNSKRLRLKPAEKNASTKVEGRVCPDGSVTQKFYPCRLGEAEERFSLESYLPLFPCTEGPPVHYTVVCDGHADCLDSADEAECYKADAKSVPDVFACKDAQLIDSKLWCNGVQDCLDGSDEEFCRACQQHPEDQSQMIITEQLGCVPEAYNELVNLVPILYDSKTYLNNTLLDMPPPARLELDGYGTASFERIGFRKIQQRTHPKDELGGFKIPESGSQDRKKVDSPLKRALEGNEAASLESLHVPKNEQRIHPSEDSCPESHFQCTNGYCIPIYLLNNGEQDCPLGEDESIPEDRFTCPGYYRCHEYSMCMHADYVCDGIPQCPNKDDERYCGLECPQHCTCEGYAFTCQQMFDPLQFPQMRYLDFSGTRQPPLGSIHRVPFLMFLNLSHSVLSTAAFYNMPLLRVLDLSYNQLEDLRSLHFDSLSNLVYLDVSGNPLMSLFGRDAMVFARLSNLRTLRLADIVLEAMTSHVLSNMEQLVELDLRQNALRSFPKDVFANLDKLRVLRADNSRLCCDYFHDDTSLEECDAPTDELSSCNDLLNSDFYRVCLWLFSVLAITGNAGVMVYRLQLEKTGSSSTYRVLVANLGLSDLMMGVYIAVIGAADAVFRGQYVSRETEWTESVACTAAGFLGLLSCEVSAFAICLITLDRFLVICFPFVFNFHLTKFSAIMACVTAWGLGLLLAAAPFFAASPTFTDFTTSELVVKSVKVGDAVKKEALIEESVQSDDAVKKEALVVRSVKSGWHFYGQTGVCLPLPITRAPFPGQDYAFSIFIVLNFFIFLLIGFGQAVIFCSIRRSAKATMKDRRKQEAAVARQLFLVVMTDFCCWFPIGLLGLLASRGVPIPGVVNVLATVFVLPINSAVNPFLYTISSLLERRARRNLEKRVVKMMGQLETQLKFWPRQKVEQMVQRFLRAKLIDRRAFLATAVVHEPQTDMN